MFLQHTKTDRVAVYLPTGSEYDQISIGPIFGNSIEYNILTDGNFERHFAKITQTTIQIPTLIYKDL